VKEKTLALLAQLRAYAQTKPVDVAIYYHEEDSYLMRFANSAISLNTNEHLIRLDFTAYDGNKRASYEMITDAGNLEAMKSGIDTAAEMVVHSQPLTYTPTIPVFKEDWVDERGYDESLAKISNEERLDYFNKAAAGLETDEITLSGIFSCGTNILAMTNTRSEHSQYFKTSDAQVTVVLAHGKQKWEVIAEQSAQKKAELTPEKLNDELAFLVERYHKDQTVQLPLGSYDIVFGPAATAEMLNFFNWIGHNGGLMKRGFSMLKEEQVGTRVFSEKYTLTDDPTRLETFPFTRDYTGIPREPKRIFEEGVFNGFIWYQDDADEYDQTPTGHNVSHLSLTLAGGDHPATSLKELQAMKREKDVLYIPFLHYMNIVNPSKGVITATSRFGAMLFKADGSVEVPYNVRVTQSLLDVFSDKVEWMSKQQTAYNVSMSYGARNPQAIIVPTFVKVKDLEISHSNDAF